MAFVVFEGIDGSGKTSLIHRLCEELKKRNRAYVLTREPGGSVLGDAVRALLLNPHGEAPTPRTEILLYEAVRAQHVDQLIRPALKSGQWVICDRFAASTVAFQAYARGLNLAEVEWLNRYATGGLEPHLTVLLDLDPQEGQRRRAKRAQQTGVEPDRLELEQLSFHEAVRQGYLRQAEASKTSKSPWLVLDAQLSVETLFQQLIQHVEQSPWAAF